MGEGAPRAKERRGALGGRCNKGEGTGRHRTRGGGHGNRRIVHVADATGWAVQQALEKAASEHPNITLIPHMVAIDLATGRHAEIGDGQKHVWGVYAVSAEDEIGRAHV